MKNHMSEVAGLLHKELGEEFQIRSEVHKITQKVRFTGNGMEYFDEHCQKWYHTEAFFTEIMTGKAEILN